MSFNSKRRAPQRAKVKRKAEERGRGEVGEAGRSSRLVLVQRHGTSDLCKKCRSPIAVHVPEPAVVVQGDRKMKLCVRRFSSHTSTADVRTSLACIITVAREPSQLRAGQGGVWAMGKHCEVNEEGKEGRGR